MRFEFIPTLEIQRQLYSQPRDMQRFRWYMQQMMGGEAGSDVLLPITLVNPMGREHCLEAITALIDAGAEDAVREAIVLSEALLSELPGKARVTLNLLDDVKGGWTERYLAEAGLRFGSTYAQRANRRQRFVIVPAWSSERPTSDDVYAETLAACYRQAWRDNRGLSITLRDLVAQEGAAQLFAGIEPLSIPLGEDELAQMQALFDQHAATRDFPVQFAFIYGDEAAVTCGYRPLGVPMRGGLAFALTQAQRQGLQPVSLLKVEGGAA